MAEKKINGSTYKTEPLLATEAIRLQARLVKAIGPALSKLPTIFAGAGASATPEAKERSSAAAVVAVTDMIGALDPDQATDLIKDILEVAMIRRASGAYEQVDMDLDFTGKLGDIMPVATFVLREQFGDLFRDALANGPRVQTAGAH